MSGPEGLTFMLNAPESACLLIADISGYTNYVAGVELDHAQDILADLMGTVVAAMRPTFKLAKLEGDAAFAYALTDKVDGSSLQDTIEATYFAFRRRLRDIGHASRCDCNACILIPRLDLKFVVHHGPIARQRVAGHEELVGREVILVHRLLKNSIAETVKVEAYAAYSGPCIEALGIDPRAQGLVEHREAVDIIGEVVVWVADLEAAWTREQARGTTVVRAGDAIVTYVVETRAPRQTAWEYVTSPIRRPEWSYGTDAVQEETAAGRRGAGTTNHCIHGKDAIVEEILDWHPYDYWTTRSTMPMPGLPRIVTTEEFVGLPDGGTRIEIRIARPRPRDRDAFGQLTTVIEPMYRKGIARLREVLDEEALRIAASAGDEPPMPVAARRFLDEPIAAAGTAGERRAAPAATVDPASVHSSSR